MDPAFRTHYFTIVRICKRYLGDLSDAEDAAQETFRRALQVTEEMVGDPLPWLRVVARRVCIDELRRRQSGRNALERSAAHSGEAWSHAEVAESPEGVVVGHLFVRELLGRLTPAERRVVAGSVIEGQSGGEVAAALGVTPSTARVLLSRARGKLRRYIEEDRRTISAVAFAGWRALHWTRQRFLNRPWGAQTRAELLLPALVVTALVSGGMKPAMPTAAPTHGSAAPYALASRDHIDVSADDLVGRIALSHSPSTTAWYGASAAGTATVSGPHSGGGSPVDALLPAPDPDQVWVTDFAPSPNYSSDHTIFMVGAGSCSLSCNQLFRSSDGGSTWTYVPTHDLLSPQLLIPPSSYNNGRFYAAGANVLQVTTDGGAHFHPADPLLGFATIAPAWLGAQVVVSDVGLSFIDSSQIPRTVAEFGAAESAASPALLFPSASGFTALQLVQNDVVNVPDTLLRCTGGGCATVGQVPLSGDVQLLASPNFATDHTLVAVGGGVAVSHDAGATFALVSTQPIFQGMVIAGPRGLRLVAVDTAFAENGDLVLMDSDDLGRTWSDATLGTATGAVYVSTPRLIAAGRLIAVAADPQHPGSNVFICSTDGASWSGCSAQ